jgi:hypothetical protein
VPLNDPEGSDDDILDPTKDLSTFQKAFSRQFKDLKTKHRDVVDHLRDSQYETFEKVAGGRRRFYHDEEINPHDKISAEARRIQQQLDKAR